MAGAHSTASFPIKFETLMKTARGQESLCWQGILPDSKNPSRLMWSVVDFAEPNGLLLVADLEEHKKREPRRLKDRGTEQNKPDSSGFKLTMLRCESSLEARLDTSSPTRLVQQTLALVVEDEGGSWTNDMLDFKPGLHHIQVLRFVLR